MLIDGGVDLITDPLQIGLFLVHSKKALLSSNKKEIVLTEKNLAFILKHKLRFEDVYDLCLGLTPQNYYSSPQEDYNPQFPGKICIFRIMTEIHSDQVDIYVKLKLSPDYQFCKVLSFHEFNLF